MLLSNFRWYKNFRAAISSRPCIVSDIITFSFQRRLQLEACLQPPPQDLRLLPGCDQLVQQPCKHQCKSQWFRQRKL